MLKKYDALFIFEGAPKDDALTQLTDTATAEITRLNGKIESTEVAGHRTFSRQLKGRDHGTFVKVRFQIEAASIQELRARYLLNEDVFRVQILARDERYDAALEADKVRRTVHRAKVEAAKAAAEQAAAAQAAVAEQPQAE